MTPSGPRPSPFSPGFADDPYSVLAPYRAECPVARVTTPSGRPVWMITSDAGVRAGFTDARLSLQDGRDLTAPRERALDITLVNYDPPHHTRIRRLATPWFTAQRVEAYRPTVEAVADELLAPLALRPVADLMADFAHPFSFQVMCELFALDRAVRPDLYGWIATVFRHPVRDRRAVVDAMNRLDAFFHAETRRRLAEPGDDVLSCLVRSWDPGGEVTEQEIVSLGASLLLASYETTAATIGMSLVELLARPAALAALRSGRVALPAAADELLRFHPPGPFGTLRTATEDIPAGDTVIPAGARVLLSIAAANRDPARHADPDRLDLCRAGAGRHMTFGLGPHYCPGAPLARLELTVALDAVARHFPRMTLVQGRPRWRGDILNRSLTDLLVRPHGGRPSVNGIPPTKVTT
ncbi:cytochrome P450 [Sphaerisporangium aureirubrum]|uniref:Cytochrome P450 n=1 Tax=Sphaerisporangium aureirubrum TaxID=1544736 RepID=A0ABW1NQZ9_9ACTN